MDMEKYICPMHPELSSDKPGMCIECGMQIVPGKAVKPGKANATKHHGHSTNIFKIKFWISFALTLPLVYYSEIAQNLFNYSAQTFQGIGYLQLILASIIFFYGGWVFLSSAWRELKARLPGMMTLISLAIITAYTYSVYAVFAGEEALFWELATLITIMLLGHWMEMRAVSSARGALKELSKLLPDEAEVLVNGGTKIISLSKLKKGDRILIKPGAKVPADGMVIEGESDVNESIATGESKPVFKEAKDQVIAGTTNGDGTLKVEITRIGEETFLAGVIRLVAEAEASKSKLQLLSDRAAYYLTLTAVSAGGVTLISWLFLSDTAFAISRMVAVLVIACPHALGLAIPLVASISTTKAAKNGFLVKQRIALEAARNIDKVLFDKTGTLTEGKFSVVSYSSDETLMFAASVDQNSEHPIAEGIVREAKERGMKLKSAKNFKRIPGVGGEADIERKKVFVGHRGGADIQIEVDGRKIGSIKVVDKIRSEAKEALKELKKMNVEVAMITGDSLDVAKVVADELGISEYFARVLPHQKAEKVKYLQSQGKKVAMVGDGINDSPALAQAELGIAIGAGTNIAIEAAGIVLVRNDPRDIPKIIRLSKLTYSKMIQNLYWAAGYNVAAIPLAAGALAYWGIFLQPAAAAILMSMSTVIVAANAVLLRGKKL